MDELQLWHALHERSWAGSESTLVAALDRLARAPMRRRLVFAGLVAALWNERSLPLRRAVLGVLRGSRTPSALRLCIEALDDDDAALRRAGLAGLAAAAAHAPRRWCHALFHPRADIRRAAIESLPHPDAGFMLPWLRRDPEHATHPAVLAEQPGAGLALELWAAGELDVEATAEALATAAPSELISVLRRAPHRAMAEVTAIVAGGSPAADTPEASADIVDTWAAVWLAVPTQRTAMRDALVDCLDRCRGARDREPVRLRVAAGLRLAVDRHREAVPLAVVAVACAPGLLQPGHWSPERQRDAARRLHELHRLKVRSDPRRIGPLLKAGLARHDDGTIDLTAAASLIGWFGVKPLPTLGSLVDEGALPETIARTPACWPAVATLDSPALEHLVAAVRLVNDEAGLAIIASALPRWLQQLPQVGKRVAESLDGDAAVTVIEGLTFPADASRSVSTESLDAVAPRLAPTQLGIVCARLLRQRDPTTRVPCVLGRVLGSRPAKDMRAVVAGLGRDETRGLVDSFMAQPDAWSDLPSGHVARLLEAIARQRSPHAGRGAFWTEAEYEPIDRWMRGLLGTPAAKRERAADPPFGGARPGVWLAGDERGLADVVVTILELPEREDRVRALDGVAEAIVGQLRRSEGRHVGEPAVEVSTWLEAERGLKGGPPESGVALLVPLLERPPALAEPAAAILDALRDSEAAAKAIAAHERAVVTLAPDISAEARRHLVRWPRMDLVPIRDPQGRPWLDDPEGPTRDDGLESTRAADVLAALKRPIALGAAGQAALLERLRTQPPVGAEVIARSVARWSDPDVLQGVEAFIGDPAAPIWLRFRAALGLGQSNAASWLPVLLQLACEPLPMSSDGPTSWFSPNDWDGLLALARLDAGESRARGWLRRVGRAVRRRSPSGADDDPGARRIAAALATSPHPHAHRRAIPVLLGTRRTADTLDALEAALRAGWYLPDYLKYRLADALAPERPDLVVPVQLEQLLTYDDEREAQLAALAPGAHTVAAEALIDGAVWAGTDSLETCAELLRGSPVDVAPQWRRLLEVAPSGATRTLAIERVKKWQGRDDKLRQIADTFAWGIRTSRELSGTFFDIHMTAKREDLGFIRAGECVINVSPIPILDEHPEGRDIVEGLILHELGHHLHHHSREALEVWGRAQRHGLFSLLNLVADEHLERNIRALDPLYGDRLKRLATYAFQTLSRDVDVVTALHAFGMRAFAALSARPLEVAESDDAVRLRSGQILTELDRLGHPIARFVRALRMGMGNRHGDPVLEQALALFKSGFRRQDMRGLFEITKTLARLYGVTPDRSRGGGALTDAAGSGGPSDLLDIFGGHETLPEDANATERAGLRDADVQREIKRIFEAPKQATQNTPATPDPKHLMINVGRRIEFDTIERIVGVPRNPAKHREMAAAVRRHAQRLRRDFERLGLQHEPQRARLSGRAFDRTRTLAVVVKRDPRMLVARKLVVDSDLFLGVAIDCSGSMAGGNLDKARRFGVLLAEAARGMSNVDARFVGFTDRTIFDAGDDQRCAVSQLQSSGGNNDAAALAHVATLARASRRRSKLLIMVSDGLPTECTVAALRKLVDELTRRHGMLCAQVAVAKIVEPCFRHYVEVLGPDLDASAKRFGQIVTGLAQGAL
ncbi:MAG: vWA domain-containing protein, partial [Myxococcota bacterium]